MNNALEESRVHTKIYTVRNIQIMLDRDLAELYGVETKYLKRQVQRNIERFDEDDFMFVLNKAEFDDLRSQIGTANFSKTRALPYAFTEQGVYMLATVINSPIAIEVSKSIMRTFTKLREFTKHYNALAKKIMEVERKNDKQYKELSKALEELIHESKVADSKTIGFIKPDK